MLTGAAVECAYYQCTRLRVLRAPGFPCSLLFWRDNVRATLGRSAPREGGDVWCILSRGTSFETALSRLLTMSSETLMEWNAATPRVSNHAAR